MIMNIKNKKVVITGGAGFIGSNLAEEVAKDNVVIIIDDISTGKIENIKDLIKKENVNFVKGSITDLNILQRTFRNVDYVFHQAAIPSVPRSVKDPITTNEVNVKGTLNVLIASRDNNVKKVVYASSSSVYGDTPELPKRENMKTNPLSPYAITKLTGEYYCEIFSEIYGLSTISLRYFNVFGPKQDPLSEYAAVIPKFIKRVLENKPPIIYGDGEQTRDFTFVKDVVRANILAAESKENGVFNIASGKRITINELAKKIMEILEKDMEPIYENPRKGDIRHSLADISKAKVLSYKPEYNLENGLKHMIRWFLNAKI